MSSSETNQLPAEVSWEEWTDRIREWARDTLPSYEAMVAGSDPHNPTYQTVSVYDSTPESVWRLRLFGSKVLVRRFPHPEQVGLIAMAQETHRTPVGGGWILNASPTCTGPQVAEWGWSAYDAIDLIGTAVLFEGMVGKTYLTNPFDSSFADAEYSVLDIRDIQGIHTRPRPEDHWAPRRELHITKPGEIALVGQGDR